MLVNTGREWSLYTGMTKTEVLRMWDGLHYAEPADSCNKFVSLAALNDEVVTQLSQRQFKGTIIFLHPR